MAKSKSADSKTAKLKAEEHKDKTSDAKKRGEKAPAPTNAKDAPAPQDEKLAKDEGVVARGRTVTTEEGTFKPGETVKASKDEIARLRRIGALVDPRRSLLITNGPQFFKEDDAAKGAKEPA